MPADDFAGLALLSPIPNGDGTYSSPNDVSEVYTFTDGKRAILSVCGAVLLFNIACFGWMVLKRSYLPFKAKQLPILGLMLLAGTLFTAGVLSISRSTTYLGAWSCDVAFWFISVFGIGLLLALLFFRMFRLFLIYRYRRSGGILLLYFGVFLFWMPHIILAVTSSALRIQGPIVLNGVVGCFDISPVPMFLSAMVTTFNCIVLFIFSILNRRRIRQKYLNEYRLVRWQSIVTAIFYILLVGLHVGKVAFVHKHGYAVSLVPVAMVSILFWGIVGPPFYNFIFHREAYLLAFHETFQFKFEPYSLNSSSTDNRSSSTAGGPGSPESYELATHQSTTCEEDLFHIEKADIAAANAKAAAGVAVVAGPAIFVRSISLDSFEVNREGFTPAATTGTGGVGRVSGIPASPRTSMLFQTDPTLDPRVSFNSSGSSSASSSSGSHPAAMGALHGEGRSAPSPSHAVTTGPPFAGPDAGPTPVSASSGPDSRTQVLAQDSAVPTVTLAGGHTPPPAGPSPSLAGQPFGEGPLTGSGGTLLLSGQESGEESAKESAGEFTSEEDLSEKEHAPEHPDPGEASMSSDASASDSSSPPSRASSRSSESDDALPPLGGPNDDDTSSDE